MKIYEVNMSCNIFRFFVLIVTSFTVLQTIILNELGILELSRQKVNHQKLATLPK